MKGYLTKTTRQLWQHTKIGWLRQKIIKYSTTEVTKNPALKMRKQLKFGVCFRRLSKALLHLHKRGLEETTSDALYYQFSNVNVLFTYIDMQLPTYSYVHSC